MVGDCHSEERLCREQSASGRTHSVFAFFKLLLHGQATTLTADKKQSNRVLRQTLSLHSRQRHWDEESYRMRRKEPLVTRIEDTVVWLLAWCAIAVVIADILLPHSLQEKITPHVPLATLFILSLFAIAFLRHSHAQTRLAHAHRLGLKDIYASRYEEDQIGSFRELLTHAKHELLIVGITLRQITKEHADDLRKRAAKGCTIDLLMLSPKFRENTDPVLDPVAHVSGPQFLRNNFCEAILSIRNLAILIRDANATQGSDGKFTVRFYSTVPTVSLVAQDGGTGHGRMHVEVVPHQRRTPPFRPVLSIQDVGEGGLFKGFYDSFRSLRNDSIPYIEVGQDLPDGMRVNDVLDANVSAWLGIPTNWKEGFTEGAGI